MMLMSSGSSVLVAAAMVTLQMTSFLMTSSHGGVPPAGDVIRTERYGDAAE